MYKLSIKLGLYLLKSVSCSIQHELFFPHHQESFLKLINGHVVLNELRNSKHFAVFIANINIVITTSYYADGQ